MQIRTSRNGLAYFEFFRHNHHAKCRKAGFVGRVIFSMQQSDYKNYNELAEKYHFLAENTLECIWRLDLNKMKFTYISPAIVHIRGLSVEEAMLEKLEDSFTPEAFKKIEQRTSVKAPLLSTGDRTSENLWLVDEFQQYHKDGSIIDVEISTKYLIDELNNTIEILGVTRDITQRKKLEAELKRETKQKNDLIQQLKQSEEKLSKLTKELKENYEALRNISERDKLTGVYNRHFFDQRVVEELERAKRYKVPISLIMFDLDHFKKINDQWGHGYGDEVLVRVATCVQKLVRHSDVFARWGGEEFIVMLPQTTLQEASFAAEKLREAIEKIMHPAIGQTTASFGVAECIPDETFDKWSTRVDRAMYRAKSLGRNCVVAWKDTEFMSDTNTRLEWSTEWNSGNKKIDEQHGKLLLLANDLMESSLNESELATLLSEFERLLDHIIYHFNDEEKILRASSYEHVEAHESIHAQLIEKTYQLKDRLSMGTLQTHEILSFIIDELIVGHLLTEDVKFFSSVKDPEVSS